MTTDSPVEHYLDLAHLLLHRQQRPRLNPNAFAHQVGLCMEGAYMRKVRVAVTGEVSGFAMDEETDEEAQARLVLEAEMSANGSKARLHLHIASETQDDTETHCSHNMPKTERCEQCVHEGVYTYAQPSPEYSCAHGKKLFERCDECARKEVDKIAALPEGYGAETE